MEEGGGIKDNKFLFFKIYHLIREKELNTGIRVVEIFE